MKKRPNAWLVFSSLAIQIGVLMYAAVALGQYLDQKNATAKPWWTLGCCVFGLVIIIRRIIQQTKKL
ncbi:AtpZ/AtpI family protein [Flavobacteriaceae bacterium]|nr:AtpZ/AtpI family protein [Flavobacteriaceae bacterium]